VDRRNRVTALVHGAEYFPLLHRALSRTCPDDHIYFADFRGDTEELLDGAGSEVGDVLGAAARRNVRIFGLIWRSQRGLRVGPGDGARPCRLRPI
jgi:hypothetical protein